MEFQTYPEPKALSAAELKGLVNIYGDYIKTALEIGASEAFIRQNCKQIIKEPSF